MPGQAKPSQTFLWYEGLASTNSAKPRFGYHHVPSQTKPEQATPSQARPSQARSGQVNPGQARPSQAKPSQAKPSQTFLWYEGLASTNSAKPSLGMTLIIELFMWFSQISFISQWYDLFLCTAARMYNHQTGLYLYGLIMDQSFAWEI